MRTAERWTELLMPRLIHSTFPPRLQQVLTSIPFPDSLPDKVESSFIYGPTDFGKTVYAALLLLQEHKKMYLNLDVSLRSYVFTPVPELFFNIRESYNNKSEFLSTYLSNIRTCDFLILDDIGIRGLNDWGMEILYLIVNYRYEFGLKTIFTSNLSLQELAELYTDDRIISRIQRMCKIVKKTDWRK